MKTNTFTENYKGSNVGRHFLYLTHLFLRTPVLIIKVQISTFLFSVNPAFPILESLLPTLDYHTLSFLSSNHLNLRNNSKIIYASKTVIHHFPLIQHTNPLNYSPIFPLRPSLYLFFSISCLPTTLKTRVIITQASLIQQFITLLSVKTRLSLISR